MDHTGMDQEEMGTNESESESDRLAELKEDKAREARRWQRKRATIKRFAGMK
ncbi:MAG: hypothetical protein ACP5OU_00690 [Methanothrix sp.]